MSTITRVDDERGPNNRHSVVRTCEKPPCPPESRPVSLNTPIQECLFVLSTTVGFAQEAFFNGITVGLTALIGRDLDMNIAEIAWISAGFT